MKNILIKIRSYAFSFISPMLISIPLTPIERYIFSDWEFLKFLVIFMILDTVVSWWYHIKNQSFSSDGFSILFVKIIVYSILLIIAHGFGTYTINGESIEAMKWFRSFICTALLVKEAISILENLNKVKPGLIPESITKHLGDFGKTGKFNK